MIIILSNFSAAHKILIISVHQASHLASMLSIAEELDRRGHEVRMLKFDKMNIHVASMASIITGSKFKQLIYV